MTGDLFGSNRCDCGDQLTHSFDVIGNSESGGAIIYMTGDEGWDWPCGKGEGVQSDAGGQQT